MPDKWKNFSNLNAPLCEAGQFVFLKIREINQFFANLIVEASIIKKDEHFAFGVTSGKDPNYKYPSEQAYIKNYGNTLNYYTERLKKILKIKKQKFV